MSDPAAERRLAYLRVMGVTAWQRRGGEGAVSEDDTAAGATGAETAQLADSEIAGMDWEALADAVASCRRCPLHRTRTQGVFGIGDREARWMIIGEAPGAEEDRRGEPFVGRAGKLLDEMLRAVGLDRASVYIANILKSRPPSNRDPKPEEIRACRPYLDRQIELIQPALILAAGRIAAQQLLASDAPVGRLRSKVHSYGRQAIPLIVTYHPAYLLRSPEQKAKAWADLQLARSTSDSVLA